MLNLYKLDCGTATYPLALIGPISIVWEACAGPAVVRQTEFFLKKKVPDLSLYRENNAVKM